MPDSTGCGTSCIPLTKYTAIKQAIANGYLPRVADGNDNKFALAASPVQFDETPLDLTCAPGHGEHTDALLAELGFGEEEIIEFKINSVVL